LAADHERAPIEGAAPEFPMMIMDGSPGLPDRPRAGHNLRWDPRQQRMARGDLDEGFTSFQTGWFFERTRLESEYPSIEK